LGTKSLKLSFDRSPRFDVANALELNLQLHARPKYRNICSLSLAMSPLCAPPLDV